MSRKRSGKKKPIPKKTSHQSPQLKPQKQSPKTFQKETIWQKMKIFLLIAWKAIVGMGVILSIVGFVFFGYPRLDLQKGDILDPSDPFKTVFIVKNSGYFSIYDIVFSLQIDECEGPKHQKLIGCTAIPSTKIKILKPNEQSQIDLSNLVAGGSTAVFSVGHPILSAIIEIDIKYNPIISIPFTMNQKFKATKNYKDELIWIPIAKPINDGH